MTAAYALTEVRTTLASALRAGQDICVSDTEGATVIVIDRDQEPNEFGETLHVYVRPFNIATGETSGAQCWTYRPFDRVSLAW